MVSNRDEHGRPAVWRKPRCPLFGGVDDLLVLLMHTATRTRRAAASVAGGLTPMELSHCIAALTYSAGDIAKTLEFLKTALAEEQGSGDD